MSVRVQGFTSDGQVTVWVDEKTAQAEVAEIICRTKTFHFKVNSLKSSENGEYLNFKAQLKCCLDQGLVGDQIVHISRAFFKNLQVDLLKETESHIRFEDELIPNNRQMNPRRMAITLFID